ncbi:hypothetical protein B296_00047815 [Ensete ventricosum]|uniref:Uncharacterized protein n=1 Tax=Ensete ventricosum TaxID=4639 RepID=A0A426X3M8_ENSVE|nr:hypothetical protein B296_00047815 [Ensete ventricosum]
MAVVPMGGPLCDKRRCPYGSSSYGHCAHSRLPCRLAPFQKGHLRGHRPCGCCLRPQASLLQVSTMPAGSLGRERLRLLAAACRSPLQGVWPWPATPAGGLAMASHPSSLCSLPKRNKNT